MNRNDSIIFSKTNIKQYLKSKRINSQLWNAEKLYEYMKEIGGNICKERRYLVNHLCNLCDKQINTGNTLRKEIMFGLHHNHSNEILFYMLPQNLREPNRLKQHTIVEFIVSQVGGFIIISKSLTCKDKWMIHLSSKGTDGSLTNPPFNGALSNGVLSNGVLSKGTDGSLTNPPFNGVISKGTDGSNVPINTPRLNERQIRTLIEASIYCLGSHGSSHIQSIITQNENITYGVLRQLSSKDISHAEKCDKSPIKDTDTVVEIDIRDFDMTRFADRSKKQITVKKKNINKSTNKTYKRKFTPMN